MAVLNPLFQGGGIDVQIDTTAGGSFSPASGWSAGAANFPAVASPDVAYITLDPDGINGAPEIVMVTAHTAAATTFTFTGAQFGTVGRIHLVDETWVCGPLPVMLGTTLIQSKVLGSAATNIDFSSIPSIFNHLEVVFLGASDQATFQQLRITLNGDTGSNYDYEWGTGQDASNNFVNGTAAAFIYAAFLPPAGASPAGAAVKLFIPQYSGTVFHKTLTGTSSSKTAAATNLTASTVAGWWRNTAAINRLTLTAQAGNLITGSVAYLYGVN